MPLVLPLVLPWVLAKVEPGARVAVPAAGLESPAEKCEVIKQFEFDGPGYLVPSSGRIIGTGSGIQWNAQ